MVIGSYVRQHLAQAAVATAAVLFSALLVVRLDPSQSITIGLAMLGLIAALYLSISHPKAVYYLLIVVLPLEAALVWEIGFSLTSAYMIFALCLLGMVVRRERIALDTTEAKLFVAFLAVCALSLINAYTITLPGVALNTAAEWRASALRPLIQFGLMAFHVIFFLIVLQNGKSSESLMMSLRIYFVVAGVLMVIGCYQTIAVALALPGQDFTFAFGAAAEQNFNYGQTRFYSGFIANFAPRATFRESLHFSHYLVSIVPLAITVALYKKQLPPLWRMRRPLAFVVLGLVTLLLTISRSGWVAFACSMLFLLMTLPARKSIKLVFIAIVILTVAIVGAKVSGYLDDSVDLWRLVEARMDVERMATDPRVSYFATLMQTFSQYPLLGVGIGNYGIFGAAAYRIPNILSAHSIFLNALVETGIFGFLLFAAIIIHFFARLLRAIRRSRDLALFPYLVGVGAGVLGMSVQYLSFGDRPSFYYLFMLATGYALIRLSAQRQSLQNSD